jgi:hypothetical protein
MRRYTLQQARYNADGSIGEIAKALGLCPTSSQFLSWLNEAQQRIIDSGHWVGTSQVIVFPANTSSTIAWPRGVASIEGLDYNSVPIVIRNKWFEYLPMGPGFQSPGCASSSPPGKCGNYWGGLQAFERPSSPLNLAQSVPGSQDLTGTTSLNIYIDSINDAGKPARIFWIDHNGNKYYDPTDGSEGMYFPLNTLTVNIAPSVIYGIQNGATVSYMRISAISASGATMLAAYEPGDANPEFRVQYIPNFITQTNPPPPNPQQRQIQGLCKMELVPVVNPTDFLMVRNLPAIKLAMMAIKKEQFDIMADGVNYWAMAIKCMENELRSFQGAGERVPIQVDDSGGNSAMGGFGSGWGRGYGFGGWGGWGGGY